MKIKGLYKKRGRYYYQAPQRDGQRPKAVALQTADEAEAVQKVFLLRQDFEMFANLGKGGFRLAVGQYMAEKKRAGEHGVNTSLHSEKVLSKLVVLWGDIPLGKISADMIREWRAGLAARDGLRGRKFSEASIASYMRVLKGFLSWCVESKKIGHSPFDGIKMGRVKKTRRQEFLTIAERETLLESVPSDYLDFVLHFGFFAGLRFGEMLAMSADWVDMNETCTAGTLTVQETDFWKPKDRERRIIPLHSRLVAFVNRYGMRKPFMLMPCKADWPEAPKLRFDCKKQLKNHVRRCGIDKAVSYHTLRHSFGTHLAQSGAKMISIAQLLGDNVRVVEEHYVGFSDGEQAAVDLI